MNTPDPQPRDLEFLLDDSFTRADPNMNAVLRAAEAAGRRTGGMLDTTTDNIARRSVMVMLACLQGALSGAARRPEPLGLNANDVHLIGYNATNILLHMKPNSGDPEKDLIAYEAMATGVAEALDDFIREAGGDQPTTPPN